VDFYTSIAAYYDQVFPFKPQQKAFVESFGPYNLEHSILDIGCGTGSLILSLSETFGTLVGIDTDAEMLQLAKIKSLNVKAAFQGDWRDHGNPVFLQKGMLDIEEEFMEASFGSVICLGNTLVHLSSKEEIKEMLRQAFLVLKPGGRIFIQIINYDRIFDQMLPGLPTIETDIIKFERIYRYQEDSTHVAFHTVLSNKKTGTVIENEVLLLALRPWELRGLMLESGFVEIGEFGSFKKEAFISDSQAFIISGLRLMA